MKRTPFRQVTIPSNAWRRRFCARCRSWWHSISNLHCEMQLTWKDRTITYACWHCEGKPDLVSFAVAEHMKVRLHD